MTNGVDFPDATTDEPYHDDAMRLWRNDGAGVWTEVAAAEGITETRPGNGLLVFDYDADGDLDVFVVHNAATPVLYENQTAQPAGPHRLRVRAMDASGSHALGAQVTVTPEGGAPQYRVIGSATHFLGWSDPAAHFGLGAEAAPVRGEVRLPGASEPIVRRLAANALDRTLAVPESRSAGVVAGLVLGALRALVRPRSRG